MREILFKAKERHTHKWIEGFYACRQETTYAFAEDYQRNPVEMQHYIIQDQMTDWGLPNRLVCYEVDPETVCQYTGLTDKNGVRIFESDLLRFDNGEEEFSDYAVDWIDASWKVVCDEGNFPDNPDEFFSKCAEIIGNIHDLEANPDD